MSWLYILLFIGIVLFAIGIAWLLTLVLKENKTPDNNDWILNFNSHLDKSGRFLLSLKDVDSSSFSDRSIYIGIPKDIDYKKIIKNNITIEDVKVIGTSETVINCPKGFPSKDKNIIMIFPPNAEDFPAWIKDTSFGKVLMETIESRHLKKDILSIVKKASNLKTQYLHKLGDGEISNELMEQYEKIFKQLKDLIDKKQSTSLINPGN